MQCTKFILLAVILIGCSKAWKTEPTTRESNDDAIKRLLGKFREFQDEVFEVYSTNNLREDNFLFKGTRLDSTEMLLLPVKMREVFQYDHDFYACFKFTMDSLHVGLVVRTPSEYEATSIKLFVLDNSSKVILPDYVELAESTGDAGYALTKTTLIFKDSLKLRYLVWHHDSEDMSVENENDTTIKTSDHLQLLSFDGEKFNTLESNTDELLTRYKQLKKE